MKLRTTLDELFLDIFEEYRNAIVDLDNFSNDCSEQNLKELCIVFDKIILKTNQELEDFEYSAFLKRMKHEGVIEAYSEERLEENSGELRRNYQRFAREIDDESLDNLDLAWYIALAVETDSKMLLNKDVVDDVREFLNEREILNEDKFLGSTRKFTDAIDVRYKSAEEILHLRENRKDLLKLIKNTEDVSDIYQRKRRALKLRGWSSDLASGLILIVFSVLGSLIISPPLEIEGALVGLITAMTFQERLKGLISSVINELYYLAADEGEYIKIFSENE